MTCRPPLPDIDPGFFADGISEIRTRDKCRLTLKSFCNEIDLRMQFMASGYSLVFDLPTLHENSTVIFFTDGISEIRTRDKCRLTLNRIYNENDLRIHLKASGRQLVFALPTPPRHRPWIFS